jgi:hypothetical protein
VDVSAFDDLARRLATGTSRRAVLRGLIGAGAALAGIRAGRGLSAPPQLVDVCQFISGTGRYEHRTVNDQAVGAILAQGGFLRTDCCITPDCPTLNNATAMCATGTCAIAACDPGFGDCDGNALNGCEADLNSNSSCGNCDTVCPINQYCGGGGEPGVCGGCVPFCPRGCLGNDDGCGGDCACTGGRTCVREPLHGVHGTCAMPCTTTQDCIATCGSVSEGRCQSAQPFYDESYCGLEPPRGICFESPQGCPFGTVCLSERCYVPC